MMKNQTATIKGYKMFNNDWTCKGFQYEVGKTYHYDGEISLCESGFHFCEKLEDCFKNYACIPWNRIAEIEAKGNIIRGDDKCVTDIITIIKEISFNSIKEIIKKQNCNGVNWSDGVNGSYGVNRSFGLLNCKGLSNSLFCLNRSFEYYLFNKKVKKGYWEEINENLYCLLNGWSPTFNNLKGLYSKSGERWSYTPIPQAEELSIKEAWQRMPKKAINYLKSLPEFDANIFKEITGIEV